MKKTKKRRRKGIKGRGREEGRGRKMSKWACSLSIR